MQGSVIFGIDYIVVQLKKDSWSKYYVIFVISLTYKIVIIVRIQIGIIPECETALTGKIWALSKLSFSLERKSTCYSYTRIGLHNYSNRSGSYFAKRNKSIRKT